MTEQKKSSQPQLKIDWIFGIRTDIFPNLFILDLETILYPASHYIVIYNHKKSLPIHEQQTFIPGTPFSKGIKRIAVSTFGKKYVVLAEELGEGIILTSYFIGPYQGIHNYPHRIGHLSCNELKVINNIYSLSFSNKEKVPIYLLAVVQVEGISGIMFILWKWDNSDDNKEKESFTYPIEAPGLNSPQDLYYKSLKNQNSSVGQGQTLSSNASGDLFYHISFSLIKNENFCLVNNTFFQFYIIQNEKKPLLQYTHQLKKDEEIFNFTWMHNGIFSITTQDFIYFFNVFDKKIIDKIGNDIENGFINQIIDNERFLILLGSNSNLKILLKNEFFHSENDFHTNQHKQIESNSTTAKLFDKEIRFKIEIDKEKYNEKGGEIQNFDFLYCLYNTCDIINNKDNNNDDQYNSNELFTYFACTSKCDLIKISIKYSSSNSNFTLSSDYLISPFHSDSIEGMDICINKPYIITGGLDKHIKIWNYIEKKQILQKTFEEEIYSIAFHPSGMHVLLSGLEKIRPMNIYYDDILPMTQAGISTKKARDIHFSNGGHLFAFDSNLKIEIWDFMNMQPLNNDQQNIRTKINSISFKHDDESLFICCAEALYEWKLGDTPYRPSNAKTINFLSACSLPSSNSKNEVIASADDGTIKRFTDLSNNQYFESKFEYIFTHLFMFKFSKYLIGAVKSIDYQGSNNIISNQNNNMNMNISLVNKDVNIKVLNNNSLSLSLNRNKEINPLNYNQIKNGKVSSCLRLFQDVNYLNNININEPLIPSHYGETTRIKVNYDENLVFSTGQDGCINIYTIIDSSSDIIDEDAKGMYYTKGYERFTDVVLLKKSKLKEIEIERTSLPEKKNEFKNSKKSNLLEEISDMMRKKDDLSTRIASNKKLAQEEIQRKKDELEELIERAGKEIDDLNNKLISDFERKKNEYQIELTEMQRKVELRRDQLRKEKENFKNKILEFKRNHSEEVERITNNGNIDFLKEENHEKELDEEILILKRNQISDVETIDFLNNKLISTIDEELSKLKQGIENLKNYHNQKKKKLNEKIEQQNSILKELGKELTQIDEQKEAQNKNKIRLEEQKNSKIEQVEKIRNEINNLETNIKNKKVWNSNLEKCKYVLDYQIKELKKETGPLDKTIEELKKHTKGLERRLNKYSREHDIIKKKLVNFDDLKDDIKKLNEKLEFEEKAIQFFKYKLHQCKENIGDEEFVKNIFEELKIKYINDYDPPIRDQELKNEFENQKNEMMKNAKDLSDQLKVMKKDHSIEIEKNREENTNLIHKIDLLKKQIKSKKSNKSKEAADKKHISSIAAIEAQKNLKFIEDLEFNSQDEKIRFLEKELQKRKEILRKKEEKTIYEDEDEVIN